MTVDEIAAILAFIDARLAEERSDAQAALKETREAGWKDERWMASDGGGGLYAGGNNCIAAGPYGYMADEVAGHIARQDPPATLARVEALRALSDSCGQMLMTNVAPGSGWQQAEGMRDHADSVVRHVAAIWPNHPDYRAEWAP